MKSPKATLQLAKELLQQKINVLTHASYFEYQYAVLSICLNYQNDLNKSVRYTARHEELDCLITEIVNTIEWKVLLPFPKLFLGRLKKQSLNLIEYYKENYGPVV